MRALLVLFIALFAAPVLAQDADPLPACETADIQAALRVLLSAEFPDKYGEVTDGMQGMDIAGGDLLDVIEDLDDLQTEWWAEIVPEFPACVEAANLTTIGGRMLDEMLAMTLFGQLAYEATLNEQTRTAGNLQDRFNAHLAIWTDFQQQFIDTVAALSESVQE